MGGLFEVLDPGAYTTVQDRGRFGFQHLGVPTSGSADGFSSRLANLLVGNDEDCAVLETTVLGPRLRVVEEADVAIAGAEMPLYVNDKPGPRWSSFRVAPGDVIHLKMAVRGCRAYLAVRGGVDVPLVMGSRSTCVGARLGGFQGRQLKKGDMIGRGNAKLLERPRTIPHTFIPDYPDQTLLRAIPGPQDHKFDKGLETFFGSEFLVSSGSDRMGCRLEGPTVRLKRGASFSIISEPIVPGGVQIPQDGQPIIVLAEQTVGGYSKIAVVISSDLHRVAQSRPGDRIRFELVDLATAHKLFREQEALIRLISQQLDEESKGDPPVT